MYASCESRMPSRDNRSQLQRWRSFMRAPLWCYVVLVSLFAVSHFRFVFFVCPATTTETDDALQYSGLRSTLSRTSLAYQQSFGFFDDILDHAWNQMKFRAQNFYQYKSKESPLTGWEDPTHWYFANLQPNFSCPRVERIGGHDDGPKWTCDPTRLLKRKDCLIYSVGSQGNYIWEDGLIDRIGTHCEIHVFDPGHHARPGDAEKRNIHYHRWGLKSSYEKVRVERTMIGMDATIFMKGGDFALMPAMQKMLTFEQTRVALGHQHRTIDVLKMDCENCEWSTYRDWVSADIRQVLIETHGIPSPNQGNLVYHDKMNVTDFFDEFLVKNNYVMFSKEINTRGNADNVEFGFLKLHPAFWGERKKKSISSSTAIL